MTAAETLLMIGVIFAACALVCWLADWDESRQRRRRVERLRERRQHLDSQPARRWDT